MAESNGIELRGNEAGFKYYDGQIIGMQKGNKIKYYQIVFSNSGNTKGGYTTNPVSVEDAKRISSENFAKLGTRYDMKTAKSADGVNLGFIRIPEDKKSEANITLSPTKADLSILDVPKETTTQTETPQVTENQDAQMQAIERRVTTPVVEPVVDRGKVLEAYKRNVPEMKAPMEYKSRLNLEKVPEYTYNLNKPIAPVSSDKMWEMAIARRAASGNQLPARKFNGGQNGPV